ncbi:glycosyltransferase [Aquabacterium sp.]|uniref:glycosyltransferase n=1 Tax=Aquabacterium sp. TaxID=1872578 RepID=UPI002C494B88|nr:glycosyltransferase [Aquabacterium sp.]HSW03845.1 glycosyltransferase [Aquabacterium sp.]
MSTIDLIYFNAGGGHRAAALALQAVIAQQRRPWTVRLVNLVDVLDPQALFRKVTGLAPEDLYNKRLAKGWTLGLAQELKLLQGLIRLGHAAMRKRLARHWQATAPDLVVSLVPNFNRVLFESLAQARPGVPYVTVMTDMADHPPNFWIEPDQPQHIVCGTPMALAQARAAGHAEHRLHLCSGMILRPDFYDPLPLDRVAERQRLGLPLDQPVALVLFGGQGSPVMSSIARQLPETPLILLCGHNAALAAQLRAQPAAAARVVVGYTTEVRRYMALADVFIGKPGPGSLSEAVQQGLPVITSRNAFTMPQERYNVRWVRENGLGVVVSSFRQLAPALQSLLADRPAFAARVAGMHNRAVFEVPEILADLLSCRTAAPALHR